MALKIWLPLYKNYKNYGLHSCNVTNLSTTMVDNGITGGKCVEVQPEASSAGTKYIRLEETTNNFIEDGSDFTFACFVKITGNFYGTNNAGLFCANAYNDRGFGILMSADRKFRLQFCTGGSEFYPQTNQQISADEWHHICVVYQKSPMTVKYYYDGACVQTQSLTGYSDWVSHTTQKVNIGKGTQGGHGYTFPGLMCDVRFYDNALTEQDIKELSWGKVFEFTPQWGDSGRMFDASGTRFPLLPENITINGNVAKFNGSSSHIEFNAPSLSGGTVSMWINVPSKPTAQKIVYFDPVSKMIVGFLSDGNILTAANGSKARYLSTGMTWGQMNNIVATWDSSKNPTAVYVNGVAAGTGSTTNWTNSGTIAEIGKRTGSGAEDYFNGDINEIKVFRLPVSADDAKYLYDKGPCPNEW